MTNTSPRIVRVVPPDARTDAAILYFHGGGYIAGSPETHRALIGALARISGLAVFAPAYRLAPEHPFPAAWDDAQAAWEMVLGQGFRPDRILLGGDSAGGGLALSLLARLCGTGTPPAGAFAFSPWTDLAGRGASIRTNADSDALLPAARLPDLTGFVLAGHPADDPRASPVCAAYPQCPPILLFASRSEILLDDSRALAARLAAEGAPVTLSLGDGLPHAWPAFAGLLPEAMDTIRDAAAFARRTLGLSAPPQRSAWSVSR